MCPPEVLEDTPLPLDYFPPSRHWHSLQYCVLTVSPQQSPPSYVHSNVLLMSSQQPSPIHPWLQPFKNQKKKYQQLIHLRNFLIFQVGISPICKFILCGLSMMEQPGTHNGWYSPDSPSLTDHMVCIKNRNNQAINIGIINFFTQINISIRIY